MATDTVSESTDNALLINYNWHHAVNSQSKLNDVLTYLSNKSNNDTYIEAIEADIIHSEVQSKAVMGHPPLVDGDLTLVSFLQQVHSINFQQQHDNDSIDTCPVLKLDFKSMEALQSSLSDVQGYLSNLPTNLHRRLLWINADIMAGPGEDLNDAISQKKIQPKFNAEEFVQVVSTQLPGTVLSIGWTTSLSDRYAPYTDIMVDNMIECCKSFPNVTFPIRGTSFKGSWSTLKRLYDTNPAWTVTLWWSYTLSLDEFKFIHNTLESDETFRDRTYYDLRGFRDYLLETEKKMDT